MNARQRLRSVARRPVVWGTLRRRDPFSHQYGYDRGTPIDRALIERFLQRHRSGITGRVLEIKDDSYASAFGTDIRSIDVLDIDPTNGRASIVGDLCDPDVLAPHEFDCAIVTQTLMYVDDPVRAIGHLASALARGGTLLITVPVVARIDPNVPDMDRWRLTPAGLDRVVSVACPDDQREVSGLGNLVTSIAFLHGLAAEELRTAELTSDDPAFPLIACAWIRRTS